MNGCRVRGALFHGGAAERIGHKNTVITVVPPSRAEIRGMAHQSDATAVPVDQSRVITPSGWLAPRKRSRLSPGTAGDEPAVELGQGGGNTGAKSHFLLIAKDKVYRSRLNFGFPTEKVRLGSRLQDDAGNELTQRTVGSIQQLTDRGEP